MPDSAPPYVRIAAELRRRITTGRLRPGDRMPSTRQLTRDWGVALATAAKALTVLQQEGLVRAVPRVGSVVAEPPVAAPAATPRAPRRPGPAPGRTVTVDDVVSAAVAIADEDGLVALSMRSVAARLGIPTMSLYGHVRSKDDLVLLMIDHAFGEHDFPAEPPAGWRDGLAASARQQWACYREHLWLAQVVSLTRPQPLANLLRLAEWNFSTLITLDLDQTTLFDIHLSLCTFVRGVAIGLAPEADAERDTGMTGDEWVETAGEWNELIARSPVFRSVAERGNYVLDMDRLFAFGLERLLDGLAVRLGEHPT
ncbi:GntR family transcriptional regulator [Pseudonocardia sp. GCM10023141]|uniref:GntR family transcriptional regulator n=1 Tax=Pseudonocardia sp. GCM10023141 TaxID=3252653 RepID=UPI00360FF3A8